MCEFKVLLEGEKVMGGVGLKVQIRDAPLTEGKGHGMRVCEQRYEEEEG